MRICIHRGTKQIGGTCIELEQDQDRILLDIGLPLDGNPQDAGLVPDFLSRNLRAVLISHPHLDHYGLLHHLASDIPVLMGASARNIIRAAAPFTGQTLPEMVGPDFEHQKPIQLGAFTITPYLVDHSAFDAYALLIEVGGQRIFYSGDFRAHGRKARLFEQLVAHPPEDIDVLLMEGSSLSRLEEHDRFPTEAEIEQEFLDAFRQTSGMVLCHTSAQNIDRVVSLYRACRQTGRTLIIDLYAAAILEATGYDSIPQSSWPGIALYVPESQRKMIKKHGWFDLLQRHASQRIYREKFQELAHQSVMLFRPLMINDLDLADCLTGAQFLYSQWLGYLENGTYARLQTWLEQRGIPMSYIHTSGHASPADLKRLAAAIAAKALVPIHSFATDQYVNLFDHVEYHDDGEWWDLAGQDRH